MRKLILVFSLFSLTLVLPSCKFEVKNPFWADGEEQFEVQQIFDDERFPNVVVATDGTVVATWGRDNFRLRRSEDGGKNWGDEITVANPGFQGGGTTVDETTGDMLVFVEEGHPVAPLHVFRSKDHGKSWNEEEITIVPNSLGHIPSMHMNEHGITLKKGKYAGRLIRPTRFYGGGNGREFWDEHYTNFFLATSMCLPTKRTRMFLLNCGLHDGLTEPFGPVLTVAKHGR